MLTFFCMLGRVEVDDAVAVGLEHGDIAVVEVDDLPRVRENGGHVARDEVLAVAEPDEQRAALARGDDLVRVVARDDRDAVRAFDLSAAPR